MIWFLALLALVAIVWIFMRFYKRRLDALTGPWIAE
jgi:hypothetical protein